MKFILLCIFCCLLNVAEAKKSTHKEPTLSSVILFNLNSNKVEYEQNSDRVRPIASITKLMTAMVALDYDRDLQRRLMLSSRVSSSLPKQEYSRYELITAMLVRSDNAAAETIADDYPGGRSQFIRTMNNYAKNWDMEQTSFSDPTGLSVFNVSTATDLVSMLTAASGYWFIQDTTTKKQIEIETKLKKKIRTISLNNTNRPLLFTFDNIRVSKTGFTSAAGRCVALYVKQKDQDYIIIVLGSKDPGERAKTVKDIMYGHVVDLPRK